MKYYAYFLVKEQEKGIVTDWKSCSEITKGKHARYMSFKTIKEAEFWLDSGGDYDLSPKNKDTLKTVVEGVYFDSGKKQNGNTRVKLANEKGECLISSNFTKEKPNRYNSEELNKIQVILKGVALNLVLYNGCYVIEILKNNITNNVGELISFILACDYAKNNEVKLKNKLIIGDSALVVDFWSKKIYNRNKLNSSTVGLIELAYSLRKEVEELGFEIKKISGDLNPADLGDHK